MFSSTSVMLTLAGNRTNRYWIQPELDKRAAKQLMEYVLHPTLDNIVKAKAMVAANPRRMFVKTQGVEPASGIEEYVDATTKKLAARAVHRKIVNCSPFQAVLGTGDSELYNHLATHFDKVVYRDDNGNVVETGVQRALEQIKEKFPNGFDYPPIDTEFRELMTDIVTAITADQTLIANNRPSEATQRAIAELRKYLLQKNDVTQGHHFNLNYLSEAFNVYFQNWEPGNGNQSSFFWCQVLGYLERQVTVVQAQAICEGITNHLEHKEQKRPHGRGLAVYNYLSRSDITYFSDPAATDVLGLNIGIDIYPCGAQARGARWRLGVGGEWHRAVARGVIEKFCQANTPELNNFLQHIEQRASQTYPAAAGGQLQAVHNSLMERF
jgi:hypothetical protein